MAAKNFSGCSKLSRGEKIGGTIFFGIYFLILPFCTDAVFDLVGKLIGRAIDASLRNVLCYYLLFAVTAILFRSLLAETGKRFFTGLNRALFTFCVGLLAFYGGNELVYRVCRALFHSHTNLNDLAIAAQGASAPRMTVVIVIALAPFVEEVLFRGLIFGGVRPRSRIFAYLLSCVLFALMHVWTVAVTSWDMSYLALMLQYLVPGLVFAWAYEHSGTLWTSVLLHAAVNALSLVTILS